MSLTVCQSVVVCSESSAPGPTLVRTGAGWRLDTGLGCSVVTPPAPVADTPLTRHHVDTATLRHSDTLPPTDVSTRQAMLNPPLTLQLQHQQSDGAEGAGDQHRAEKGHAGRCWGPREDSAHTSTLFTSNQHGGEVPGHTIRLGSHGSI